MKAYWDRLTLRQMFDILSDNNIVRTVRINPTSVEFFYAGRVVSLSKGEAKWFCLAHLYHTHYKEHDL